MRSPEPTSAFQTRGHEYLIRRGCRISVARVGLLEGGRARVFSIYAHAGGKGSEGGCVGDGGSGVETGGARGGGVSQWEGGYMTCHAVPGSPPPSSNHLSPSSLSPRAPRHPPGIPSAATLRPVPSSRHPLPHRSALMSGKNKTASPTAKAGVSPSPTTANDIVYRKEGGSRESGEKERNSCDEERYREKERKKDNRTKKECAGEREKGG